MNPQPSLKLAIAVKGEIISLNFEEFREYATAQIEEISFDLKTDDDFEQAADDVKGLKKFEESLTDAKAAFLAQMDDVNQLLEQVDRLHNLSRATRIELDKRVKDQKAAVKEGIIRDGIAALLVRNREFSDMIGEAIKGKSSLVKMQEAVTEVVEEINKRITTNAELFERALEEHGEAVAYGKNDFVCLSETVAIIMIERRIERHRAALKEAAFKAKVAKLLKEKAERDEAEARREAESVVKEPLRQPEVGQTAPASSLPSQSPKVEIEAFSLRAEPTEAEELSAFISTLLEAFAKVKEARAKLQHPRMITAAGIFADVVGAAFKTLKSGLS
jgi:hypothetical protein